jgi:hypothetical protein
VAEPYGVFVSSSRGSASGAGTRASPLSSIQAGIALAQQQSKSVYLCAEQYTERITLVNGVSIFGGLDCSTPSWAITSTRAGLAAPSSPAITATGITSRTRLDQLDVRAPSGVSSSIALLADGSPGLHITRSRLTSGDALNGIDGASPAVLQQLGTLNGQRFAGGLSNCRDEAGQPALNGGNGGDGGRRGTRIYVCEPCEWDCPPGSTGTCYWQTFPPTNGYPGSGGASGGIVGGAGPQPGSDGASGINGTSASGLGRFTRGGYVPSASVGTSGGNGQPGQGGGGAAGTSTTDGLGGGAGGCGGRPGGGGTSGGGSIAILAFESPFTLDGVEIAGGRGGAGGQGGRGAAGTPGGTGGASGGRGGAGGNGGSGAGGPSIGIAYSGNAPQRVNTTISLAGSTGGLVAELYPFWGEGGGANLWSRIVGTPGGDTAYRVASAPDGTVVIAGYLSGTADIGCGPMTASSRGEYFLARLQPATGQCLWSRSFGSTGYAYIEGLAVDADAIYVTGGFTGTMRGLVSAGGEDIFVAKHDASGTPLWTHRFGGGSDEYGAAIAVRGQDVVFTGALSGSVSFGGADITGGYVASYSLAGAHKWSRPLGGAVNPRAIVIDSSYVTVAGSFSGTIDPGTGSISSAGSADILLLSYAISGQPIRARRFGGPGPDSAYSIAIASDGFVFSGLLSNGADLGNGAITVSTPHAAYVARIRSADSLPVWSRVFDNYAHASGVAVGSNDEIALAGAFAGTMVLGNTPLTARGTHDAFLLRFGPSGEARWARAFGAAGWTGFTSVTATNAGWLGGGAFSDRIDLGNGPQPTAGDSDGFLLAVER